MAGALEQGLALAALLPEHRAKFYKFCATCGAKPKQWCDQRIGTICTGRGEWSQMPAWDDIDEVLGGEG